MENKSKQLHLTNWNKFLKKHNVSYFLSLNNLVKKYKIDNQLNFNKPFTYFSPSDLKVVILGQDPYPNDNDANGLAFDVSRQTNLPPSMNNIIKKLLQEYSITNKCLFVSLEEWAKQGVLLINSISILSKDKNIKNEGKKITYQLLNLIMENYSNVIFIGFGNKSLNAFLELKIPKKNYIWGVHPSPLSSYRGFFDKCYFTKCNEMLKSSNICEIKWLKALNIESDKRI